MNVEGEALVKFWLIMFGVSVAFSLLFIFDQQLVAIKILIVCFHLTININTLMYLILHYNTLFPILIFLHIIFFFFFFFTN